MSYKKSEREEFRKVSVRTFQLNKEGNQYNEGSGVLFHYLGTTYLLTAGHCASDYDNIGLEVEYKIGKDTFIPVVVERKINVVENDDLKKDYAIFVVKTPDVGYFSEGKLQLCDIEVSVHKDDDYMTYAFPKVIARDGRHFEIESNEDDYWEWKNVTFAKKYTFHDAIEGGSGAGALNLYDGIFECAGIFKRTRDEVGSCNDIQVTPAHVFLNEILSYIHPVGGDAQTINIEDVKEDYITRFCSISKISDFTSLLRDKSDRYTLLDFVRNEVPGVESFRYILFGQPQSGKSFELQHYAHVLTNKDEGEVSVWYVAIKDTPKLTSADLPEDDDFRTGYRPVVFVDGLDESSVRDIDANIQTLKDFALAHPTAGIVISCRETYKFDSRLDLFTPLYFEDLTSADIEKYISQFEYADKIREYITGQDVYELCKTPIGLKGIVEFVRKHTMRDVEIPRNQVQLYESLVYNRRVCMREANKEVIEGYFKKTDEALSKIAIVMVMTDKQTLSANELDDALASDQTLVTYCTYYYHNLFIQDDKGLWCFENHAFKEYYAAEYLYRMDLQAVHNLVCAGSNQIKEQWYNVLLLWLQKKGVEGCLDQDSVDWIVQRAEGLLVKCDPTTLSDDVRFAVFTSIMEELAKSNRRYDVMTLHSYKHLFEFAKDEKQSVELCIANELKRNIKPSAHLYNILTLSAFIDWNNLRVVNQQLYTEIVDYLFKYIEELGDSEDAYACFYFFCLSKHFYKDEKYVDRLFQTIQAYKAKVTINAFCMICSLGDWSDKYIDYLLGAEMLMEDTLSHYDSKEDLYKALSSVYDAEKVKAVLLHEADINKARHEYDAKPYIKMMTCLVRKASEIQQSGDENMDEVIYNAFRNLYDSYYFGDSVTKVLLPEFKEYLAGMVVIPNDIQSKIDEIDNEAEINRQKLIKNQKDHQDSFDRMCEYDTFRTQILTILEKYPDPMSELPPMAFITDDHHYETFVANFFRSCGCWRNYNPYIVNERISSIEDYELFRFDQIVDAMVGRGMHADVSGELKELCFGKARAVLRMLIEGKLRYDDQYARRAVNLLINERFDVDKDLIINLIPYSFMYGEILSAEYPPQIDHVSLFDYIEQLVPKRAFLDSIRNYLYNEYGKLEEPAILAITKCLIEKGSRQDRMTIYQIMMTNMGRGLGNVLLDTFLNQNLFVKRILRDMCLMSEDAQMLVLSHIDQYPNVKHTAIHYMESHFEALKPFNRNRALRWLLNNGSMVALEYVTKNKDEQISQGETLMFRYSTARSIPYLLDLLPILLEKGDMFGLVVNSVNESLLCIAEKSYSNMRHVIGALQKMDFGQHNMWYHEIMPKMLQDRYYRANQIQTSVKDAGLIVREFYSKTME